MIVRLARVAAVLALVASSRVASAQWPPEEGARRELLSQAEQAADAGEHARALELARRAASIRPSTSLVAFFAREHRALDQRVEALDAAGQCLREVAADAALRNRDTIREACEAVRASVEGRVGRLAVHVAGDAPPGLSVRVGARVIVPALYGVASPVMPGAIVVRAEAPGFAAFTRELVVREGEVASIDVTLTAVAPPVTPPVAPPVAPLVAVTVAPPILAPPAVTPPSPPRASPGAGPWILGGAAIAGFGVAAVFYGLAMGARADRDALCPQPEQRCPSQADVDDGRYADWLTGTNVALSVGAAAAVGAAVWIVAWRLTGHTSNAPRASALTPGLAISF